MKPAPLPFRGFLPDLPRGVLARMRDGGRRWAKPVAIALAWTATAMGLGLVLGLAAVVLPPTGAFGIVAVAALVLLWAVPDLARVPTRLVRRSFFVFLVIELCAPIYYALDIPSLPWISLRRIAMAVMIALFGYAVAASSSIRRDIVERMKSSLALTICVVGFYVMVILSILTAINPVSAISGLSEMSLEWMLPFLVALYVVRTYGDAVLVMRIIGFAALFNCFWGVMEFSFQRKFLVEIFPASMLEAFLAQNPYYQNMFVPNFRNGLYRAISTFVTANSFGEFGAIVFPIGLFFAAYGGRLRDRVFGVAVAMAAFVSVVVSGSRVGYVGMLVAAPMFTLLWIVRETRREKGRMFPTFVALLMTMGFTVIFAAVLFWRRAQVFVMGDGMAAYSTQARYDQWASGIPHILANPITGHGNGSSGMLVGWGNGDGLVSVDSYPLTLLVDFGVPGFLFFTGLVLLPIWYGLRGALTDKSQMGALRGALACSFLAYAFSRVWLSQKENHSLMFVLVAVTIALNAIAAVRDAAKARAPEDDRAGARTGRAERPARVHGAAHALRRTA